MLGASHYSPGLVDVGFDAIVDFFYRLAEAADRLREEGLFNYQPRPLPERLEVPERGTLRVKLGFPIYQKGGVVMDVTNTEQAEVAEEAGAVAVMVLDKLPYDVRKSGGVARMADVKVIEEVMETITIPVMAKVRIGHYMEARILEEIGVDMIDESEVLTPVDEKHHINKWLFTVPFVNGARDLGEALRRITEGAAMIRTKGEAGTGNVAEAVRHMKIIMGEIRMLRSMPAEERIRKAREYGVPHQLVDLTARLGRLPVVNFAAGGIATPADAARMMREPMTILSLLGSIIIRAASGKSGMEKRKKPYAPILMRMPARMTEPAVGASVWASGSQVCTGHMGTLTAKAAKKAQKSTSCNRMGYWFSAKARISKVFPPARYRTMMPTSIRRLPTRV